MTTALDVVSKLAPFTAYEHDAQRDRAVTLDLATPKWHQIHTNFLHLVATPTTPVADHLIDL